jgi:hypothetical protein
MDDLLKVPFMRRDIFRLLKENAAVPPPEENARDETPR